MSAASQSSRAEDEWVQRVLGVNLSAGGRGNAGALAAAIVEWRQASEAVDSQIGALQLFLRNSDDEELQEIGKFGLNALTGNHRVRLMAAMHEAERGNTDIHVKLAEMAANFRDYLDDNDYVDACDENPFGVAISIKATLLPALDRIERVLSNP